MIEGVASPAVQALIDRAAALPDPRPGGSANPDRQALLDQVIAAGAGVPVGLDRDALRDLMFTLAAQVGAETGRFAVPALADFAPAAGQPEPARVGSSPAGAGDTAGAADARPAIRPDAAAPDQTSGGPAPRVPSPPPRSRIVRKAAATFRPQQAPEPEPPPQTRREATFEQVRFAAMARQWQQAQGTARDGLLLAGDAIEAARRHAHADPDIAAFVAASVEAAAARRRRRRGTAALVLLAVALIAGLGWVRIADLNYDQQKILSARQSERAQISEEAKAAVLALTDRNLAPTRELLTSLVGQPAPVLDLLELRGGGIERSSDDVVSVSASLADLDPAAGAANSGGGASAQSAFSPLRHDGAFAPWPGGTMAIPGTTGNVLTSLPGTPDAGAAAPGAAPQNPVPAPRPATPAPDVSGGAPLPADLGTCGGAMWLGNAGDSRLAGGADPQTLAPGARVAVATASGINLRDALPDPDYTLAPAKGVVPNGGQVTLTSAAQAYLRPDGTTRLWAEVEAPQQNCTRVFLQFAGRGTIGPPPDPAVAAADAAIAARADRISEALRTQGFAVPPAEYRPEAIGKDELRYFHDADARLAEAVAAALVAGNTMASPPVVVPLTQLSQLPAPGVIELWLDLGAG